MALFVVQGTDCDAFSAYHDLDPAFARGLKAAAHAGVMVLVYACDVAVHGVTLRRAWRR